MGGRIVLRGDDGAFSSGCRGFHMDLGQMVACTYEYMVRNMALFSYASLGVVACPDGTCRGSSAILPENGHEGKRHGAYADCRVRERGRRILPAAVNWLHTLPESFRGNVVSGIHWESFL